MGHWKAPFDRYFESRSLLFARSVWLLLFVIGSGDFGTLGTRAKKMVLVPRVRFW